MKNRKKTLKTVIIVGIVIAAAVAIYFLGGGLLEMIKAHMGL